MHEIINFKLTFISIRKAIQKAVQMKCVTKMTTDFRSEIASVVRKTPDTIHVTVSKTKTLKCSRYLSAR